MKLAFNRRTLLKLGLSSAVLPGIGSASMLSDGGLQLHGEEKPGDAELDSYVRQYMTVMRAPGLTLVLVDDAGVQRVANYGSSDLDRHEPIPHDALFHIGSITKSFISLIILQLVDEGKLDLHSPLVDYLPWFATEPKDSPVTTHHLLTHTSGLPSASTVLPTDGEGAHTLAYAPGTQFFYNNLGYDLLGYLAWTLDGRDITTLFRERIFQPLGMKLSEPIIDFPMRERTVRNYTPFLADRYHTINGRIADAVAMIYCSAAGCIASTASDMGPYIKMLLNRGQTDDGRLISESSFELMSSRHVSVSEDVSYGYGFFVRGDLGREVLSHTGGSTSFMSSLVVDLSSGVGAFSSINAQHEYRPTPVVEYALEIMKARQLGDSAPPVPSVISPWAVEHAGRFDGVYRNRNGAIMVFVAREENLYLHRGEELIILQPGPSQHSFIADDEDLRRYPLMFSHGTTTTDGDGVGELEPFTLVAWGDQIYSKSSLNDDSMATIPDEWLSFLGHYRNDSPWMGSLRIVARCGVLYLNGTVPLRNLGGRRFQLSAPEHNTNWIEFGRTINDRCIHLSYSGNIFWRVFTD